IAIPIYIGVQNNAKDSAVKTDVGNLKTAIVALQSDGSTATVFSVNAPGTFPASGSTTQTWAQAGATYGADTTSLGWAFISATAGTFCITGASSTGTTFYATDTLGVSTTKC
ncbi:MAG: type pilus assembly protein PilA, partial [Actinomycetota bacterium]|nr:type pilus assembly protein PilA [Actinomycetota bacterium]